jgi:hypothetical protein
MDSKHRHELEQNELAKWIIAQYEDWIRPNSGWLGYAVVAVLVVVAVILGTARVNTWNRHAAWKQYYAALYSEQADAELEAIAQSSSGIIGVYARLALAQRQLTEGSSQVSIDKTLSIVVLEKAITSFQYVQKATSDPLILQQAGFGLGMCWETLAAARTGDDLAKAREEYQRIVDRWGESFIGQRAQEQLALLRQPTTETFLKLTAAKTKTAEPSGLDDFRTTFGFGDPFESAPLNFGVPGEEPKTEVPTIDEPKPETNEE